MNKTFGKFLNEKRKESNLTQKQLAQKLYVSESTISKWEKGKANPDISMISELAEILNVSEHELITASTDKVERKVKKDAHKWNILSHTCNLFFIISYTLALLTCLICNIAIDGQLSWFWIVFFAILLAASFTTFPQFIHKCKLLFIPLSELLCFLILCLVCNLYTHGTWFWLAILPTLFTFIVIFLPIYINKYKFSKLIKKHCALFSILVDIVLLIFLIWIICIETNGNWFTNFAFPIILYYSLMPILFVIICRYTKINNLLKASLLTFSFFPFLLISYLIIQELCLKTFNIQIVTITLPNFNNWSNEIIINSNVYALIGASIILASLTLLILYFRKKYKKIKIAKN